MAITFIPQKRKQQYFLLAFGTLLLLGMGVVWYQFIREAPLTRFSTQPPPPQSVQIDFRIFENPAFLELGDPRPPIPILLPGEVGKPNPFTLPQ
ncbi:MAG: hypothetical protein A2940_00365 [Candidatus Wildermuthbacteria bacterium RIFCSPLOWO2_01_FULL_48_29]|uniref:Uncharacterized protein n=1 Tax=Candidatus Wildermuthbacteria bacterium RIFCSPLOWO2_01_FULL_48_29 TaxID=1802462 RepID=A0A1G2RPB0_9BACT|nr:MAG: hypothetical protein A2940_00365 [Candidatus Wildermuthbacteria bacterium RIFCSPLOWO2_01_FULL_48_29]